MGRSDGRSLHPVRNNDRNVSDKSRPNYRGKSKEPQPHRRHGVARNQRIYPGPRFRSFARRKHPHRSGNLARRFRRSHPRQPRTRSHHGGRKQSRANPNEPIGLFGGFRGRDLSAIFREIGVMRLLHNANRRSWYGVGGFSKIDTFQEDKTFRFFRFFYSRTNANTVS